jgi:hypothetical protein
VEVCVALQARHASTIVGLAKLASLIVTEGVCPNTFHHIEAIRVAEFHFRMPERAVRMHPVVVCGALEWLARNKRSALILLSGAVVIFGGIDEFFLHALLLPVPFALLLVCNLGVLEEFLFGYFMRTQHALVGLDALVIGTC